MYPGSNKTLIPLFFTLTLFFSTMMSSRNIAQSQYCHPQRQSEWRYTELA